MKSKRPTRTPNSRIRGEVVPDEKRSSGATGSADSLTPEHHRQVTNAAVAFLDSALRKLEVERVLPRSRYEPWIQVGRHYEGWLVDYPSTELQRALEAALPERFPGALARSYDYANLYGCALVEAAVAAATRAGEDYSTSSLSVRAIIKELIEVISHVPLVRVAAVVSDLSTPEEGALSIGDVRVLEVGNEAERRLEEELPGAGFLIERSHAFAFPGPTALLISEKAGRESFENLSSWALIRNREALSALRLATSTTAHVLATVRGQPSYVHPLGPYVEPQRHRGPFRMLYRPVELSPSLVTGTHRLIPILRALEPSEDDPYPPPLVALSRFNRSLDFSVPAFTDQVVDLAVGLEAALSGQSSTEIGFRLRNRAANLLARPKDPAEVIYDDVKQLYDIRSSIVHGSSFSSRKVQRQLEQVSSAKLTRFPGEVMELALDRWRDLLRRAIATRLALAQDGDVVWPLSKEARDVDRALASEGTRRDWRERIEKFWEDLDLPSAVEPAVEPAGLLGIEKAHTASE